MDKLDVRIVKLAPVRVASFWGFGEQPEYIAWQKLEAWAKPKGLFSVEKQNIYGFNNPDPTPGSPNYGYELWIEVDKDVQPEGDLRLLDFCGGLYAVTRCEVPKGDYDVIGATWKKLVAWQEDSPYKCGHHQCLEKSVPNTSPELEFILDLYMPLAE